MATAVSSIAVDELAVRLFLQSLFQKQAVEVKDADAAAATAAPGQSATGLTSTGVVGAVNAPDAPALRLHPRVDAAHPLGTAQTAAELEAALRLYSQMVAGMSLEVDDVLLAPDKALATGHLVVDSRVSALASAGASAASSTADLLLPQHLREVLAQASSSVLPEGLKAGRVPITIQMRLGKNDAGDAVVTHMSLIFSLLSMLLPHIQLSPWQQQLAAQSQPALLGLLQQIGAAASVAGDTLTSVEAAWRAGTAVLQATVGQVLATASQQAQHLWASGKGATGGNTPAGPDAAAAPTAASTGSV